MVFTWQDTLSLLGAAQGFLLSLLLFRRTRKQPATRILAWFTLIFSVGLLERFFPAAVENFPSFQVIADGLGGLVFLYGPLVYLFVRRHLGKPVDKRSWILHLSLFGGYELLVAGTALLEQFASPAPGPTASQSGWVEYLLTNLVFLQVFTYCYLSLTLLQGALDKPATKPFRFAFQDPIPFTLWLYYWTLLLTTVYFLSFLGLQLAHFGISVSSGVYASVQIGSVVVVYLLSYRVLAGAVETKDGSARKYRGSALTEPDKDRYLQQLLHYLEQEKPYLDPALTIDRLAKDLGVNRYYLSQIINERRAQRFSDFINAYRVEEVKRLLRDPGNQHLSILALAYEAGFQSKSTFNTTFKKITGMSPSEYRKQDHFPS